MVLNKTNILVYIAYNIIILHEIKQNEKLQYIIYKIFTCLGEVKVYITPKFRQNLENNQNYY